MSVNNVLFELIIDFEAKSAEEITLTGTIKRPKRQITSDDFTDKLVKYTCNIKEGDYPATTISAYIRSVFHRVVESTDSSGSSIQFVNGYITPGVVDGYYTSELVLSHMDKDPRDPNLPYSWAAVVRIVDKFYQVDEIKEVFVDEFHREEKYI